MKKVFLVGFSTDEQITIAEGLIKKGVNVLYWIGRHDEFESLVQEKNQENSSTIFHNSFDAFEGKPASGVDVSQFEFPGSDVWNFLKKREMQIFQIMDALDSSNMKFVEKKRLYFTWVCYWYGVLRAFKPEAILFVDVPHIPHNLIIYQLAEFLGIKNIISKRAKGLPDMVLFFQNFDNYNELAEEYERQLLSEVKLEDLSADFQAFYQRQNSPKQGEKLKYSKELYTFLPDKIKESKLIPPTTTIWKHIKSFTFFRLFFSYIWMLFHTTRKVSLRDQYQPVWKVKLQKRKRVQKNRKFVAEYQSVQTEVDWNKKFIYIPLHLQPECTTNPLGGVYDDQMLMIEMLSRTVPKDWVIYIKENPLQWQYERGYFGRYEGYYRDMVKLKNVQVVPLDVSTFDLICSSQVVATVTGTAGWEALIRSKPVLVFGSAWYKDCKGVFVIKNTSDCEQALKYIENGYRVDRKKIFAFLKAVETIGVRGYTNKKFGRLADVASEEKTENFIQAYYKHIQAV